MGAHRLGYLVLVMGEGQIVATAMYVECRTEKLQCHRGAFYVPTGTPASPWRLPARQFFMRWFPEHEIHWTVFVWRYLDTRSGNHVIDRTPGKAAVVRKRTHAEKNVSLGLVCMPFFD